MRQRNWKVVELHTAATSFKFLPLIILYPFILSFIVRPLSIQHVCNCLLLQRKTDFTIYKFITTLLAKKNIPTNLESYSYKCAIVLDCLLQMVYPYGRTLMVLHVETLYSSITIIGITLLPKLFNLTTFFIYPRVMSNMTTFMVPFICSSFASIMCYLLNVFGTSHPKLFFLFSII